MYQDFGALDRKKDPMKNSRRRLALTSAAVALVASGGLISAPAAFAVSEPPVTARTQQITSTITDNTTISRGIEPLTSTFVVKNLGTTAKNVTVTEQFPATLTLVSAPGLTLSGTTLSGTVNIPAGGSHTYTIATKPKIGAGTFAYHYFVSQADDGRAPSYAWDMTFIWPR